MDKNFIFMYIISILFILINNGKVFGKDFYVRNNDTLFKDLNSFFIKNNQNYDQIVLYFVDNYYNMTELPYSIEISVNSDIYFIGSGNETVFDYDGKKYGRLIFNIYNLKEYKIKFENIILRNYYADVRGIQMITLITRTIKYNFEINNCIFEDNMYTILHFSAYTNHQDNIEPKILINNSRF